MATLLNCHEYKNSFQNSVPCFLFTIMEPGMELFLKTIFCSIEKNRKHNVVEEYILVILSCFHLFSKICLKR